MKISKMVIFSTLICAFALPTSAQTWDGYVYETDKLDYNTLGLKLNIEYKKEVTVNSVFYIVNCVSLPSNSCIEFGGNTNVGLVIKKSKGIVKNMQLQLANYYSSKNGLELYVKSSPYTDTSDLYNNNQGSHIGTYFYTNDPILISLEQDSYYWGIKGDGKSTYLSNITITWQLAHIRHNLTPEKLGTICLPYGVKISDWKEELTPYAIAGKIKSSDDKIEALVFEEVEEMKAGVAYLFVPKKTDICLKYYGTEVSNPIDNCGFVGSFSDYYFTKEDCKDNDIFLLSDNSIRLAGAGAGVGANRAYIKMSDVPEYKDTNSSRKLLLSADGYIETGGVPTVVEMLRLLEDKRCKETTSATTYDLQGRMFNSTPMHGVILQSGKKRLIGIR